MIRLLDALAMSVNNLINIFLINSNIISYHVPFINYLRISKILLVSIWLKSTEKKFTIPFNPVFFILLILKSFEILRKIVHNLLFRSFFLCTDIFL